MPLLERTRSGPKLNDAGRVLVGHAEAALARLQEAEHELKAIAGLEGGELRIASFPSASATLLTEALGGVRGAASGGAPDRDRGRARGVAAPAARGRGRPRDRVRLPDAPAPSRGARPRARAGADRGHVPGAPEAAIPWRRRRPCGLQTSRRRPGCAASARARAATWSRRHAERPDSIRRIAFESDEYEVLSRPTSPPGSASRCCPTWRCPTLHSDLVVRPTKPEAPKRRVWAAIRAQGARSAATDAMVEILRQVGQRFADQSPMAIAA